MKRHVTVLLTIAMVILGLIAAQLLWLRSEPGELLNPVRFNWYESKTHSEIESGNKLAQERLNRKYHIFVNGIFIDIGYYWDGTVYVPIRSVSQCLNWSANWLPDLGVIHLVKDERESFVDIVNLFGKGYIPLERLEKLLYLDQVRVFGGNIEIQTGNGTIASIGLRDLDRLSFYINDMKMSDRAVQYQGLGYVPSRIFALCFGKPFKYDAQDGSSYVDGCKIDTLFIDGEAYSTLECLKGVIDTEGARFSFQTLAAVNEEMPPVIDKGSNERVIALTFDDYLGDKVYPLLEVLESHDIKATFFIIGNSINENTELLGGIVSKGHQVANHTWDHYNSHTLTEDEIRAQLISTQLFIEKHSGQRALFFRPPGGYYNDNIIRVASEVGLQTVLWSVNSNDAWPYSSAQDIQESVIRWAHPGGIVAMHTNNDATIEALPNIVEQLRNRGYKFVTISELIATAGG